MFHPQDAPEATHKQRAGHPRAIPHRVLEFRCRDDCRNGWDAATGRGQHVPDPAPMTRPAKEQVTVDLRAREEEPGPAERGQSGARHAEVAEFRPIVELNEIDKVSSADSRLHVSVASPVSRSVLRDVVDDSREVVQQIGLPFPARPGSRAGQVRGQEVEPCGLTGASADQRVRPAGRREQVSERVRQGR